MLFVTSLLSLAVLAGCSTGSSSATSASASSSGTTQVTSSDDVTEAGSSSVSAEEGTYSYSGDNDADKETLLEEETAPDTYDAFTGNVISAAGNYLISGTYESGLEISAAKGTKVHLFLSNAAISSSSGKALYTDNKSMTVIITVLTGTSNTVTNDYEDTNALHVKGDLYINGDGTLTVTSKQKSAIKASGYLGIKNAKIITSSKEHGFSGEEVYAEDADLSAATTEKDGIHAEQDIDNSDGETYTWSGETGYIKLNNVAFAFDGYGDGIQADSFLYVYGGTYDITTHGTFISQSVYNADPDSYDIDSDDWRYILKNGVYTKIASDYMGSEAKYALANGVKGMKVGEIAYDSDGDDEDDKTITGEDYYLFIGGGANITANTQDDAVKCNYGDITIDASYLTIDAYDDGASADGITTITNSTVKINSCYEGLEGEQVILKGDANNIQIDSEDDGINAASDYYSDLKIQIEGGYVYVNADGDGLDSNGYLNITGGTVVVDGPSDGGNSALDTETGIYLDGGTVLASGSSGMLETPSSQSTQYCLVYSGSSLNSGTVISLKDSSGNTLLSHTLVKTAQAFTISSPDIGKGSSYTLYSGSSSLAVFTVSAIVTSSGTSSSGNTNTGGNGGQGFGPGGR